MRDEYFYLIYRSLLKQKPFMKRSLILIFFLTSLSVISCKKEDKEKTTIEKIQAKWTLESVVVHIADYSVPYDTTLFQAGTANDYFDFRADGKVYSFLHDDEKISKPKMNDKNN